MEHYGEQQRDWGQPDWGQRHGGDQDGGDQDGNGRYGSVVVEDRPTPVPVDVDRQAPEQLDRPASSVTDAADQVDLIDPSDPADSTDPFDPTDSTDPFDPSDSTDQVDPVDPADSTDPTEPTDQVDRPDPTRESESIDPGPTDRTAPGELPPELPRELPAQQPAIDETTAPTDIIDTGDALFAAPQEDPGPELGPTGRPWPDLPTPEPLTTHGPAMVIAMCNQKGGVGKTTTTINLGASLAEYGRRVLLVDFDPQGSLSVGLGINPHTLELSIYNLLLGRDATLDEVIQPSEMEGVDILPANIDLSAAEIQLVSEVAREQTLQRVLRQVRDRYDFVLIDCAPSLGLLTINALTAADKVIMPLECEFFALRGIALLTDTITKVQDRLNPDLEILGILGTMYDPRTLHAREVLERVVDAFGDVVFHSVIRRTVKFPETTVAGEPITSYASSSAGAESYRMLAREVVQRCRAA